MIGVKVTTYEATNPNEQLELMTLTFEELGKPTFPKEINVLISKPENGKPLIVISIEPPDSNWDWPGRETSKETDETKKKDFGRFKQPDRLFIARRQ